MAAFTLLLDRRYRPRRQETERILVRLMTDCLARSLPGVPAWIGADPRQSLPPDRLGDRGTLERRPPQADAILILDAPAFPPKGDDCDARLVGRGL